MDRLTEMGVGFTHALRNGSHHGSGSAPQPGGCCSAENPIYPYPKALYFDRGRVSGRTCPFTLFPERLRRRATPILFTGKRHNNTSKMRAVFFSGENILVGGMHGLKIWQLALQLGILLTTSTPRKTESRGISSAMQCRPDFIWEQDGSNPPLRTYITLS